MRLIWHGKGNVFHFRLLLDEERHIGQTLRDGDGTDVCVRHHETCLATWYLDGVGGRHILLVRFGSVWLGSELHCIAGRFVGFFWVRSGGHGRERERERGCGNYSAFAMPVLPRDIEAWLGLRVLEIGT